MNGSQANQRRFPYPECRFPLLRNHGFITQEYSRLHTRQIEYFLEKYAERQGIPVKSTHKMRKTYASMLSVSGVPVDCISERLGHSSLSTTYGYIYNPLTEQ